MSGFSDVFRKAEKTKQGRRIGMKGKWSGSGPKYQQIALAIAARIANGEYDEGERVSGRSAIAGQFNVSPETARRAFCILADWDIVFPEQGSGMRIKSKQNAATFIRQFSDQKTIETIKEDIARNVERQRAELAELSAQLSDLITATEHYHTTSPLAPQSIRLTPACRFLGRSVEEIRLWQNTGATLTAIKRGDELMISPGPYAVLTEGDVCYFITAELSDHRVREYLYGEKNPVTR